jgi:hypothetical protein
MNSRDFENAFLKEKQEKFIDSVVRSAEFLNVDIPLVRFQECPYREVEEIAHIHIEEKIICVSNSWLKAMDFDDIEETASHEMTHLVHDNHSSDFHNLEGENRFSLFRLG